MQIVHYGNLSASTVLIQPVGDHDLEVTNYKQSSVFLEFYGL